MAIETVDDIVEHLADLLGIYGIHDDEICHGERICRCCWTSQMTQRLDAAYQVEQALRDQRRGGKEK